MQVQEVIDTVKQCTDLLFGPDDVYLPESELINFIDRNYKECYRTLLRYKLHSIENVETITATGALDYAIPSDILYVKAVWHVFDSGSAEMLGRHDSDTRPNIRQPGAADTYRIYNDRIEFDPVPLNGTYEIRYIPRPTTLTTDTDNLVGIENWEEFVVWGVIADVRFKQDLDDRPALVRKESWRSLMKLEASKQDLMTKTKIRDSKRNNYLGNEHLVNSLLGI